MSRKFGSITCALRDVPRAQRPTSIPAFVATWATLPLEKWAVKLDVPADVFAVGDRLLDPEYGGNPTVLCRKLSRGEVMPSVAKKAITINRTAKPKAIA